MMMTISARLFLAALLLVAVHTTAAKQKAIPKNLDDLVYREFPRRTEEEAAVLEWGSSAIISALDASVAHFGPQTSQAALLEVETMPILAEPATGIRNGETTIVDKLDNSEEVHGNIVVMTNKGDGSVEGWDLALIAKASGAAALIVVNVNNKHPDDIYRLEVPEGKSPTDIDIPVVMISYNSANVLTSATVTEDMQREEVQNHGMPDRIRLYSGGDRPFFEDVEPKKPTLYLIHNLLSPEECDLMIKSAEKHVKPPTESLLELTVETDKMVNIERTYLWQGLWQLPANKAIEEKIEQVTGFPTVHYSDFIVDKYKEGSYYQPHYNTFDHDIALATITVFLSADADPAIVYPSAKEAIKIHPKQGLAIVHHNTKDQKYDLDFSSVHGMLKAKGVTYIAHKHVFVNPLPYSRRIIIPLFAYMGLSFAVVKLHDAVIGQFGVESGTMYFDKLCVGGPVLIILLIVQFASDKLQGKKPSKKATTTTTTKRSKKDK